MVSLGFLFTPDGQPRFAILVFWFTRDHQPSCIVSSTVGVRKYYYATTRLLFDARSAPTWNVPRPSRCHLGRAGPLRQPLELLSTSR